MNEINYPQEPNAGMQQALTSETKVAFTLEYTADVTIEIYDLTGNKRGMVSGKSLAPGGQQIMINTAGLGIPAGKYVYYLQITDQNGTARECRTMNVL